MEEKSGREQVLKFLQEQEEYFKERAAEAAPSSLIWSQSIERQIICTELMDLFKEEDPKEIMAHLTKR